MGQEQQIREKLFDFLTEFPVLYQARQGVGSKILNPFASMAEVVRSHVNPLILYLNDLVQEITQGLSYLEALDRVIRFALRNKYRDRILSAVRQLSEIEGERPYFLWGLASLLDAPSASERARMLRDWHRKLHMMNRQFTERFGEPEAGVDLVPWRVVFRQQVDGLTDGTYEYPNREQLETFRTAIDALDRLVREHQLDRWIHRRTYRRILEEIKGLARLLFDYGYTVEEICGRVEREEEWIPWMLNDLLLSELEKTLKAQMDLRRTSRHLIVLTLLDYRKMIPFRTYYCRLSDSKNALERAKDLEKRSKVKVSPYRRIIQLYQHYQRAQLTLLQYYLDFQFSRAHGDYFPVRDRDHFGVDITQKFVLRYYDGKEVQAKAEARARKLYSSKTAGEMMELMHLLIQALSNPAALRGKRVHILGHIQSGAMGRVLVGIHRGNIVALKEPTVPKDSTMPLSEKVRHLEYEAKIHLHVQSGPVQHENIVECFGIVEEEGQRFLAVGYHPAETLGRLIRRAKAIRSEGSEGTVPLTVGDLKVISQQLLKALIHLKERLVIHRDLKPANILYLVDKDGRVSLIKLIDFGVALAIAPGMPKDIHQRQIVGTLGYLAPEMVFREASFASDLYSTGVIFYQLISGRLPLQLRAVKGWESLKEALRDIVKAPRQPLLRANPILAEDPKLRILGELVDRMIERDPTRRLPVERCYEEWVEFWEDVPASLQQKPIRYS